MAKRKRYFSKRSAESLTRLRYETVNSMTERELKDAVIKMGNTINRRLKGFEKRDEVSPAAYNLLDSGGKISVRGKDVNQLRAEYIRARDFLKSKTSTQKGYYNTLDRIKYGLHKEGIDLTRRQVMDVLKTYTKVKNESPKGRLSDIRYNVIDYIRELPDNMSIEEKMTKTINDINKIYEEVQESRDVFGASKFMSWD